MDGSKPILAISDLQMPFENTKALEFCRNLKRHYKIPDENILNVGDEVDAYFGGQWPKNPDSDHTPNSEIKACKEKIKEWAGIFPEMKLAISNHGIRWIRKVTGAEIPSQVMRSYEEIFDMPHGWKWKDRWVFNELKHPFAMHHGMGFSGVNGHRNAAIDAGISTIIGHLHSSAAVSYINTIGDRTIWACNAGCLIDPESFAFSYGKYNRLKPILGAVVIFDSGKFPVFHPL